MTKWFGPIRLLGIAAILLGCACMRGAGLPEMRSAWDGGLLSIPAHDPRRGPDSARVTMVEFGDFECPYCGDVEPTVRKVLATYPNDVALVFVNFPISYHPHALHAAEAFLAASLQAKAWEMHDQMYAHQAALSDADLDRYAQIIGLDLVQFDADRSSPGIVDEVTQDKNLGYSLGVYATPTFYIDGTWMVGDQSFSAFQQVIDPALAQP
jgi:protein-disulfide isomerase